MNLQVVSQSELDGIQGGNNLSILTHSPIGFNTQPLPPGSPVEQNPPPWLNGEAIPGGAQASILNGLL